MKPKLPSKFIIIEQIDGVTVDVEATEKVNQIIDYLEYLEKRIKSLEDK